MGGAAVLGGGLVGRTVQTAQAEESSYPGGIGRSPVHDGSLYGDAYEPPLEMSAGDLDAVTFPPPPSAGTVAVTIDVVERRIEVGAGRFVEAWTFGGTVPGPILRVRQGEVLRIRLRNLTEHPHNLHLHGRHTPEMDGWEPVAPGGEFTYEVVAGPAGVHPYHCHVMPLDVHISRGLYGMLIVDPPGGRPPATELCLQLGGFTVDDSVNQIVAWNGVAGFYQKFPIKVPVGEPVRAYVLNMVEYEPVASFHLHAQTFAVFPAGIGELPAWHGDVFPMTQGERGILEFDLPEVGRYMFHPHQHHLAMRGSMGWLAAI